MNYPNQNSTKILWSSYNYRTLYIPIIEKCSRNNKKKYKRLSLSRKYFMLINNSQQWN